MASDGRIESFSSRLRCMRVVGGGSSLQTLTSVWPSDFGRERYNADYAKLVDQACEMRENQKPLCHRLHRADGLV